MCRGRTKNQSGFTLVEILVATSILVIISAIMISFLMQGLNLWQLLANQSDLRAIARNATSFMALELRKTTRTSGKIPSPNLTIPSKPNNNSLDFYLPVDLDDNGYIIDSIGNTEWDNSNKIQYVYVPGLRQLQRLEKGNFYIIANDVTAIEFEDNSINPALYNDELKIILTLERVASQRGSISVTSSAIVKLRNQ